MTEERPTWAVVATVDEPPMLVAAFVAWHLSLGASEIILYFDRPDDPAADLVASLPPVRVVRCDAAYWRQHGGRRPDKHQIRQVRNAADAFATSAADWLLHCDADEFIWAAQPVHAALGATGPSTPCIVVPVAERVYRKDWPTKSVFDGVFRRPFAGNPERGRALFGRGYAMTHRGLTGHTIGKSFLRKGAQITPSIHRPKPQGQGDVPTEPATGLTLLHFDGLTPLHWVYKILRKADDVAHKGGLRPSQHRQRQIDKVLADPASAFELHDRLKTMDASGLQALARHDLLLEPDFAPEAAISSYFAGCDLSVSSPGIDDWLWANKPTLLRRFGLEAFTKH